MGESLEGRGGDGAGQKGGREGAEVLPGSHIRCSVNQNSGALINQGASGRAPGAADETL